jgi:defect-in-organelle-trafficking protein DotC
VLLAAAALAAGFAGVPTAAMASGSLTSPRVPPDPTPEQVEQNLPQLGNPLNKPITGASEDPLVVGTEPPPSLEALQATRPGDWNGDWNGDGLEPGRADMVRTAGLTYGAQGGLAARSFALNEMLRRYEAQLDSVYDFRTLVLPVGRGQTLMRPPVISAAQMAFSCVTTGFGQCALTRWEHSIGRPGPEELGFARDSPLEESGFELLVPP